MGEGGCGVGLKLVTEVASLPPPRERSDVRHHRRRLPRSGEPTAPDGHAAPPSMWPFVIGLGMAVLLSGMPLGYWIVLPGLLVTVLGTLGFVAESR